LPGPASIVELKIPDIKSFSCLEMNYGSFINGTRLMRQSQGLFFQAARLSPNRLFDINWQPFRNKGLHDDPEQLDN
jgi:hypothetical protein